MSILSLLWFCCFQLLYFALFVWIAGSRFWVNTSVHVGVEVTASLTQFSTEEKAEKVEKVLRPCETEVAQWSLAQSQFFLDSG